MKKTTGLFFCLALSFCVKSQIDTTKFFIVSESVVCRLGPMQYSPIHNKHVQTVQCNHASYKNAKGENILIKPNLISVSGNDPQSRWVVLHPQRPDRQPCFNVFYNGGVVYQGDSTINYIAILDRKENDSTYLVSYIYRHICKSDFDKLKNGQAFYKDYLLNDDTGSFQNSAQYQNIKSSFSNLNICHGIRRDLVVASNMPYVSVKIGNSEGMFLLDFGTTGSTIDTNGFKNNVRPKLVLGTTNQFADFDFYGSWGTVNLNIQDHSNIQGLGAVRQAGILGTDFLSLNSFTVDYQNGALYRNDNNFCNDSILLSEGFKPISTVGYYSNDPSKIKQGAFNIPTVPVKIGTIQAVAQIDPGFNDRIHHHSVNINKAFFDSLRAAGIQLQPFPTGNIQLTTCAGVLETVTAFKLAMNNRFEVVGTDGNAVISVSDAVIFVKDPPQEALKCGGIGVWKTPAAQIGASFISESRQVIFDPYNSLVWFSGNLNNQQSVQLPQIGQQAGQQSASQLQKRQQQPHIQQTNGQIQFNQHPPQQVQTPIQTKQNKKE